MEKIYLTENDVIKIVKDSTIAVLNERAKEKEKINEGNSYKVDFDKMGKPERNPKAGIGGFYMNRDRAKRKMASGEYGKSGIVGMHGFLKDLRELGYSDEQIRRGLNSGAIKLGDKYGNQYNTRKQNRKWARLNTLAGGVLGNWASDDKEDTPDSSSATDSGATTGAVPAPSVETRTIYYRSEKVKQIQEMLNAAPYNAGLKEDSVCGPLTIDAIYNALSGHHAKRQDFADKKSASAPVVDKMAQDKVQQALSGENERVLKTELPRVFNAQPQQQATPMPRPQQNGPTVDVRKGMSQIYNDQSKTNQEKIDLIDRTLRTAERDGKYTRDQIRGLRDAAKTYKQALK